MPINRTAPLKNNPTEAYEEDFDNNADAADVRGLYIQNDSTDNTTVLLTRDSSGNMTFEDQNQGTVTLSTLAVGAIDLTQYILDDAGAFVYVDDGDYVKKA